MINSEVKSMEEKISRKYWGLFAVVSLIIFIILILYISPLVSNYLPEDVPVTRGPSGGLNINISERPWFLNFWFELKEKLLYFAIIPFLLSVIAIFQKGALSNRLVGILTLLGLLIFWFYLFPPIVRFF